MQGQQEQQPIYQPKYNDELNEMNSIKNNGDSLSSQQQQMDVSMQDVNSESFYPPSNGHYYSNYSSQRHWSESIYMIESIVELNEWSIAGGSDYGQLAYFIDSGDIILEIDNFKVSGLTKQDIVDIINSRPTHHVKAVTASGAYGLPVELKEYLSRRFIRGSIDHDLQVFIY